MSQPEKYDLVVLGSGEGGKFIAWSLGSQGKRSAVVERRYVGGSCPNIAAQGGRECARLGINVCEVIQPLLINRILWTGPMLPKMSQVDPNRFSLSVYQLFRQFELMK